MDQDVAEGRAEPTADLVEATGAPAHEDEQAGLALALEDLRPRLAELALPHHAPGATGETLLVEGDLVGRFRYLGEGVDDGRVVRCGATRHRAFLAGRMLLTPGL